MIETRAKPGQRLGMPAERFLADYWQRQPLLVRAAFEPFHCPISGEDLAGLACEEHALSRLVRHDRQRDRWTVRNGPFDETDFTSLPHQDWTLLVQDVDKWDADVGALLAHFDFLPCWRVDDIMVSYAADGGSVGAHVDQYDVFLLQADGQRRWQIDSRPNPPTAFRDDVELRLLREFSPDQDWLLEPGDMLYLPPGVPHHGVAVGNCLTFSVGMRAPSIAELIVDHAETLAASLPDELRYRDAGMKPPTRPGEIDADALQRVRSALASVGELDDAQLGDWFGRFMTGYRSANTPAPRPRPLSAAQLRRDLDAGAQLTRNPWARLVWVAADESAILHASGNAWRCSRELACAICSTPLGTIDPSRLAARDGDVIVELVNAGILGIHKPRRARSRP